MQVLLDYPGVNIPFGRYAKRQFGELQQQTQLLIGIPRKCFLTLDVVLVSGGFKSRVRYFLAEQGYMATNTSSM
jgi:hypothetical protein